MSSRLETFRAKINFLLFKYGYQGRQNIFEYWMENKDAFTAYMSKRDPELIENRLIIEEFETKVRWRSPIGTLLAESIRAHLRRVSIETIYDLLELRIKYGKEYFGLKDLYEKHPMSNSECDRLDLRGISVIRLEVKNAKLEEIDFSYACFDRMVFENVDFINCKFFYTQFSDVKLINCRFDARCEVEQTIFTSTLIGASFLCDVINPIFSKFKRKYIIDMLFSPDAVWKPYSEVTDASFIQNCKPEIVTMHLKNQQKLMNETKQYNGLPWALKWLLIPKYIFRKL